MESSEDDMVIRTCYSMMDGDLFFGNINFYAFKVYIVEIF